MPRPKAPYFPLYASELLCDPKTIQLSNEELGMLIRLWAWMWINDVQRGSLLIEWKVPMPDETISKLVGLGLSDFQKLNLKLTDQLHILKRGKYGELYSKRLRNHKTKYELYDKQTETKRKRNGKIKDTKQPIREGKGSKGKGREVKRSKEKLSKDIKPPLSPFVELFNSTCPSLQKVTEVTKGRKDKIKSRLKEHPDLNWWKVVFEKADKIVIEDKDGGRSWKPTFNWLIKNDTKAVEVAEGNYDKFIKKESWREKQGD